MLVMVGASLARSRMGGAVGVGWVLGYFTLLTLGEIMVIPVGLALVNMLAPRHLAAAAMGSWYVAKFVGSVASGVMGSWWDRLPHATFFTLGAASALGAAGLLVLLSQSRRAVDEAR